MPKENSIFESENTNFTWAKAKSVIEPEKNTLETILVVEDQAPVLQAVRAILERAGFCMLAAW